MISEYVSAVRSVSPRTEAWFKSALDLAPFDYGAALAGVARVEFDGTRYQPVEAGEAAVIIPVGERGPHNIIWEHIDDLLAVRPGSPTQWSCRRGSEIILGRDVLARADFYREPLSVFSDPLAWVRAGGDGVVILDWTRHLPVYLAGPSHLICDSLPLAQRLKAAFRRALIAMPEIRVLNPESTITHVA